MRYIKTILFINIILLDALIAYYIYRYQPLNSNYQASAAVPETKITQTDNISCPDTCRSYIDSRVASISPAPIKVSTSPTQVITRAIVSTPAKVRSVEYVPIPGSGNTLQTQWTDIPGTDFYLSKTDYPGIKEVYLEVNMKLFNGNGYGYIRLFDATHGIAIQGSELQTASQKSVYVSSGKINLYDGNNLYRIQARSLTADTTFFDGGRLKIIVEN